MKRRGFTLVELLAIIILLACIFLLVYPKVTEILQKEEDKIDEYNLDTIYSAVEAYINNKKEFPKEVGNEYCISIKTLDEQNLLPFDASKYMKKAIRIKIGKSGNFYELVDSRLIDDNNKCKKKEDLFKDDIDNIYKAVEEYIENKDDLPKEDGNEYCILITTLDKQNLIPFDISNYKDKAVRVKIGTPNTYELIDSKLADGNNKCKDKDKDDEDTIYEAAEEYIENKDDLPKEDGKEYCVLITTLKDQNLIPFSIVKYKDKAVRIKIGTPNTYEIVDSKFVGADNKCTNGETPTKVKYTAETRTCRFAGTTYTKTTKTCNSSAGNYSCTRYRCDVKDYVETRPNETCKDKPDPPLRMVNYKCEVDHYYYTVKETYKVCSWNSSGKYYWETYTNTYDNCESVADCCQKESSFTCNDEHPGWWYTSGCSGTKKAAMSWNIVNTFNANNCTESWPDCSTSSHAGRKAVGCESNHNYKFVYSGGSVSSSIVTDCTEMNVCTSYTLGRERVICSVNSVGWTRTGSFSSSTNQATPDPTCSGSTGAGNTDVDCSRNYSYSWGSTNTEYNVATCTNNLISCNSSHAGQTYVSCSGNGEYEFVNSSETVYDECNVGESFTCDAAHEGQKYIASCTKRSD